MTVINFDTRAFPFRPPACDLLQSAQLELLHLQGNAPRSTVTPGHDNNTVWHDRFYAGLKTELQKSMLMCIYDDFVKHTVMPLFKEDIVVQAKPTLRIHWQGNFAVGAFHRDSDYSHHVEETNFWLPLTQAYGNNSIWIESRSDGRDFHPERMNYGQVLVFKGGKLTHGNKINDTEITRVSIDFRALPLTFYKDPPLDQKSHNRGKRMSIGDYYRIEKYQP